jgi:hypothetical protein
VCDCYLENYPYLTILTNIALLAIEYRINRTKALVELATTTATLLPLTNILPHSISYYVQWALLIPSDAIVAYYGYEMSRLILGYRWFNILKEYIAKPAT